MKAVLVIKATPGLRQQYLDYLDEYMHNPNPDFHSLRVQPAEYDKPALARELSTEDNEEFETMMSRLNVPSFKELPLSVNHMGMKVPLHGRFVYPFEAASFAPQRGGIDADVPDSYMWDVHSHKPRQLHLYGFEGNTTPQRYAGFDEGRAQPEGIIYGDIDDDLITRFSNKPVTLDNLRYGAMALLPNSILPLQVEDLKEKQAEAAQLLMDAGVPPLLTQGNGLAGHTPFRQWDAAPERSAIPTEELPYATNPGRVITGEPMDIAFQLLKERVSPEAKRHKLEYDKKYESTPERVKYREELNRERRRRGIYGSHDHKDISHTEGGKLTLEGEHENRARHFKDKGTLREL